MEDTLQKQHKILTWPLRGAIMVVVLGLLFKIQHWPGAGLILTGGIALLFVAFIKELWNNFK